MEQVDLKMVKLSVCQNCSGWVRAAALDYFNTSTTARNEFMKEVAKYNLAVREMELEEWRKSGMVKCNCDG